MIRHIFIIICFAVLLQPLYLRAQDTLSKRANESIHSLEQRLNTEHRHSGSNQQYLLKWNCLSLVVNVINVSFEFTYPKKLISNSLSFGIDPGSHYIYALFNYDFRFYPNKHAPFGFFLSPFLRFLATDTDGCILPGFMVGEQLKFGEYFTFETFGGLQFGNYFDLNIPISFRFGTTVGFAF
jgi:hypothetical protein